MKITGALLAESASVVDNKLRARDIGRIIGGKEQHCGGDLGRLPEPPEGHHILTHFDELLRSIV